MTVQNAYGIVDECSHFAKGAISEQVDKLCTQQPFTLIALGCYLTNLSDKLDLIAPP